MRLKTIAQQDKRYSTIQLPSKKVQIWSFGAYLKLGNISA
jgi:hypothetical protein